MIDLITRRAAAFALDLVFLAIVAAVICLSLAIARTDYSAGWDIFFFGVVVSYFVISERLCSGRTVGKRLLRIRVQATGDERLTAYQSCARISLILLLPRTTTLFGKLLVALQVVPSCRFTMPIFLGIGCWAVWPVSLVLGRGRVGIHDFLWRTEVVRARKHSQISTPTVARQYPWVVTLTTILIALSAHFVVTPVARSLNKSLRQLNPMQKSELRRLAAAGEELGLQIENGPEFISNGARVSFWRWNEDVWTRWAVKRPSIVLPDDIREGRLTFNGHAQYTVPVTNRGLSSSTFQRAITERLFSAGARPGLFMTLEYVYEWRALMFYCIRRKRFLGFLYRDVSKQHPEYRLIILEPDEAAQMDFGFFFSW